MKHNLGFTVKRIICLIIAVIMALPLSAFAYRPTVGDEEKTAVQEFKKELITLKKLGRDPAMGGSVLLTFITDSGGFLIFLGLATYIFG